MQTIRFLDRLRRLYRLLLVIGAPCWISPLHAQATNASPANELRITAIAELIAYAPLIEAVVRDAGLVPVIREYPMVRSRIEFSRGNVDAEFFRLGTALGPDFPPDTIKIGPLVKARWVMFVKNDSPFAQESQEALFKRSLAVVRGTLVTEQVLKERQLRAEMIGTRESAMYMLLAGRFDVLLDHERIFLTTLINHDKQDQIRVAKAIGEDWSYFMLHPQAKAHESALRAAFARWTSSGRWQREFMAINKSLGLPPEISVIEVPQKSK